MARRLLSHLLISLGVFILAATFFMWTIDGRVLEPKVLSSELKKSGVPTELTKLMPEIITSGQKDATPAEIQDMKDKISGSIDDEYVYKKIANISDSVLTFVRKGEPQPTINLSDFPDRLVASGVDVGDEMKDNFAKPIELNENGKLDSIHNAYSIFKMAKLAGLVLFSLIMLLEWFVAEKGQKLKRTSRVFLYAGVSYFIYWLAIIIAPVRVAPVLEKNIQADYDTSGLLNAVLKAVQGLFSGYFLGFALSCFAVAVVLYVIRHYKHGDVLVTSYEPAKKSKSKK